MIDVMEFAKKLFGKCLDMIAAGRGNGNIVKLRFGRMCSVLVRRRVVYLNSRSPVGNESSLTWVKRSGDFYLFPRSESNPHMIVSGMSGFGKSTLFKSLLLQIRNSNIPCIVFDAHNEHSAIIRSLNGSVHDALYSGINLLELDGASVGERISELSRLFKEVYSLGYIQSTKLSECLWYTYRKAGARDRNERNLAKAPTIRELLDELNVFIRNSKSQGERNTLLHLRDRLFLLNTASFSGNFINVKTLSSELHSFALSGMKSREAQIIYIGELLNRLYASMHDNGRQDGIRLYIMVDEAQFLVDNSNNNSIVAKLTEEGRKYGVGVIIVTHAACTLNRKIIANSSTFMTFYAREPSEISYVTKVLSGSDAHMSDAVRSKISALRQNEAVLVSNSNRFPVLIRTPSFGEINSITANAVQALNAAESKELLRGIARHPILTGELKNLKAKVLESTLKELIASKFIEYLKIGDEEWIMCRNGALGIEHEVWVKKISETLDKNKIYNRIIDNSLGPDILAIANNKRIAIEYETGSKSLESSLKMMDSRLGGYDRVVIVTKKELVDFYSHNFSNLRITVTDTLCFEVAIKALTDSLN